MSTDSETARDAFSLRMARDEELEHELGLAETFREKLIRIGTMDRPLAVLTVLGMALMTLCATFLLTNALPGVEHMETTAFLSLSQGEQRFLTVASLVAIVVTCAFLTLGWAYVIGGALHGHFGVRLAALACYTFAIAVPALQRGVPSLALDLHDARGYGLWGAVVADIAQLAATALPVALLWGVASVIWVFDAARERVAPHTHHRHHLKLPTFLFALGLVGSHYLVVVVWSLGVFGHAAGAIGIYGAPETDGSAWLDTDLGIDLSIDVAGQLFWVELALILVLYMAGTDFAEWAEVVAGRLAARGEALAGRAAPWLLGLAVVAVGVSIVGERVVAWGPRDTAVRALPALVVLLPMAAAAALAIRRRASTSVPFMGIAAAAIAGYLVFQAGVFLATHAGGEKPTTTMLGEGDLTSALVLWPAVALAGVFLMRRGGRTATAGLLLVMCAVFDIGYLANDGIVFGHPSPSWVVPVSMDGVRVVVAALAVLAVAALAVARRLREHRRPLRLVLSLLLGLIGLTLLRNLVFQGAVNAAERFTVVQAIVLLVALLWDVVTSGEYVGNVHTRHLPRHSRVLMYTGYIVLVATAVLWESVAHPLEFGRQEEVSAFDSELWPQLGIIRLGTPLLLAFFAVNLGAWLTRRWPAPAPERRPEAKEEAPAAPTVLPPVTPPLPARGLTVAVGLSLTGAIALAVVAVLTFNQALPWMLNPRATAPGLRAPATLAGQRIVVETVPKPGEAHWNWLSELPTGGPPSIAADYGPPGAGGLLFEATRAPIDLDRAFGIQTPRSFGDVLCSVDSGSVFCLRTDSARRLTIAIFADTDSGIRWTAPIIAHAVDDAWAYELDR